MKRKFSGLALATLALIASSKASAAVNWCAIPDLVPSSESDFERLVPLVEGATGCQRSLTDSAHDAEWKCDSPREKASVKIKMIRAPGEGISLLIGSWGMQSLDPIRACGKDKVTTGSRFEAGNVSHRDQITFRHALKTLTLLNLGPQSIGVAYSGPRFGRDQMGPDLAQALFGISTRTYPTTRVKLAGTDPLRTDVFDLVAAFGSRGSSVTSSENLDNSLPEWTLTAPTGLPGVTSVEIQGFVRHLLRATYTMAAVSDYERYVSLLDGEYGASKRTVSGSCTVRYWSAGDVSVTGKVCWPQRRNGLILSIIVI